MPDMDGKVKISSGTGRDQNSRLHACGKFRSKSEKTPRQELSSGARRATEKNLKRDGSNSEAGKRKKHGSISRCWLEASGGKGLKCQGA